MKKEKNFRMLNLIKLYLSFLFQKTTIIIFVVALILILGIIIFISDPSKNMSEYLRNYEEFHLNYFNQAFFIIQFFNSIIIATISISLAINANSFDTLFLSHTSRTRLCLAKLISCIIVLFILSIYETIIINIIPLINFPYFKLSSDFFLELLYLFSSSVVEAILSFLLSTVLSIVLIPMLFTFLCVVIKLLSNNFTAFKEVVAKIIPIVNISYDGIQCDAIILAPIWIILFSLLYLSIYCVKDIKQ